MTSQSSRVIRSALVTRSDNEPYYLEGFSLKDIAEITGVPEDTVKSRLYYARKQLAALLEE